MKTTKMEVLVAQPGRFLKASPYVLATVWVLAAVWVATAFAQDEGTSKKQVYRPPLNAMASEGTPSRETYSHRGTGWHHFQLSLTNQTVDPLTGTLELYEVRESPILRETREFSIDRQSIQHFYLFKPPDDNLSPASFAFVIRDSNQDQLGFSGNSTKLRLTDGTFAAVVIDQKPLTNDSFEVLLVKPSVKMDDWIQNALGGRNSNQWIAGSNITEISQPNLLPDHVTGLVGFNLILLFGVDIEREISGKQRRAISDWVIGGGSLVLIPSDENQLRSTFWRELAGLTYESRLLAPDSNHLRSLRGRGPSIQMDHFILHSDEPHQIRAIAEFKMNPVVFWVPVSRGKLWVVGFDPSQNGGVEHYVPMWQEITRATIGKTQVVRRRQSLGWSAAEDRFWASALRDRFGAYPKVGHLVVIIFVYLLAIGPINYWLFRNRTVMMMISIPAISLLFGIIILSSGFLSHGWRSATNSIVRIEVSQRGTSGLLEGFGSLYSTQSKSYALNFRNDFVVRPLADFSSSESGDTFLTPSDFRIVQTATQQRLVDWRVSFWQNRAVAYSGSVLIKGSLSARRSEDDVKFSNQTRLSFRKIGLLRPSGIYVHFGSAKPLSDTTFRAGDTEVDDGESHLSREELNSVQHFDYATTDSLVAFGDFQGSQFGSPDTAQAHEICVYLIPIRDETGATIEPSPKEPSF